MVDWRESTNKSEEQTGAVLAWGGGGDTTTDDTSDTTTEEEMIDDMYSSPDSDDGVYDPTPEDDNNWDYNPYDEGPVLNETDVNITINTFGLVREGQIHYAVTNDETVGGQVTVEVSAGSRKKEITHQIGPNGEVSNAVSFKFDNDVDKEVTLCAKITDVVSN